MRPSTTLLAAGSALLLAACSSSGAGAGASGAAGARTSGSVAQHAAGAPSAPSDSLLLLAPPVVAGVTWHPAGSLVGGRPATYVAQVEGGAVGLLWIDPSRVSFRLVPGVKVPEGGPALPADNRPGTWVPDLVAAFNGGFMLKDKVGGYFYAHRTVRPLIPGLGTFAITSDGNLSVGQWGRDLGMTTQTVAVRQNLPLLVDANRARTAPTDTPRTWGIANGGLWTANRSALGERADGSLVFAYGHEVRTSTMAAALVQVGVLRAMVLDMNRSWPGGFVYSHSAHGVVGERIQPQEVHPASVYFARYTKDFVAVLRR